MGQRFGPWVSYNSMLLLKRGRNRLPWSLTRDPDGERGQRRRGRRGSMFECLMTANVFNSVESLPILIEMATLGILMDSLACEAVERGYW
jgi:hypothetical protein